jgi:hypothetical protein
MNIKDPTLCMEYDKKALGKSKGLKNDHLSFINA